MASRTRYPRYKAEKFIKKFVLQQWKYSSPCSVCHLRSWSHASKQCKLCRQNTGGIAVKSDKMSLLELEEESYKMQMQMLLKQQSRLENEEEELKNMRRNQKEHQRKQVRERRKLAQARELERKAKELQFKELQELDKRELKKKILPSVSKPPASRTTISKSSIERLSAPIKKDAIAAAKPTAKPFGTTDSALPKLKKVKKKIPNNNQEKPKKQKAKIAYVSSKSKNLSSSSLTPAIKPNSWYSKLQDELGITPNESSSTLSTINSYLESHSEDRSGGAAAAAKIPPPTIESSNNNEERSSTTGSSKYTSDYLEKIMAKYQSSKDAHSISSKADSIIARYK